jgi:hypothetical protein
MIAPCFVAALLGIPSLVDQGLDRPLVLPILGVIWYVGMVAGTLALAAGLQDLLTCLGH